MSAPVTINGRTYYGLPEGGYWDDEEFVRRQWERSQSGTFRMLPEGSGWHLKDGTQIEIWPGGAVFSVYGDGATFAGWIA